MNTKMTPTEYQLHMMKMKYNQAYREEYEGLQADLTQAQEVIRRREAAQVADVAKAAVTETDILKSTDAELANILATSTGEQMEMIIKASTQANAIVARIREIQKAKQASQQAVKKAAQVDIVLTEIRKARGVGK